jgi:hypothetical protein
MAALARKYTKNASENIRWPAPFGIGLGRRSASRRMMDIMARAGPGAEPEIIIARKQVEAARGDLLSARSIFAVGGLDRFAR